MQRAAVTGPASASCHQVQAGLFLLCMHLADPHLPIWLTIFQLAAWHTATHACLPHSSQEKKILNQVQRNTIELPVQMIEVTNVRSGGVST